MVERLLAADPATVGDYRLEGRLGAGGMGIVYLASAPDGSQVALKVLADSQRMSPELRSRLAREARSLTALTSPHVVRVLHVEADAASPFLVMGYAQGEPLDKAVPEGGLAGEDVRVYGSQLAGALAEAHAHGIVHRDLKPNNVILGDEGISLVDFGIASLEEEGTTALTRDGAVLGSLAWLAPEVVAGGEADERSDVFGLGLVLGYLALGRHPYGTGRPEAVMYRMMHEQPDLDGCDPGLRAVTEAALARDPAARPTAAQVGESLLTGDVPVASIGTRAKRRYRRTYMALAGLGVAAIATAGTLAGSQGSPAPAGEPANGGAAAPASPVAAEPVPASPPAIDAGAFSSACTWSDRSADWSYEDGTATGATAHYRGECEAGTLSAKADNYQSADRFAVDGSVGGRVLTLEVDAPRLDGPLNDTYVGTFDGVPVRLIVERTGDGYTLAEGSHIGDGTLMCTGPQATRNEHASGPDTYLLWDNPSTVSGEYGGDARVSRAEAAAICNLVTVGVPQSGILFLGP